METTAVILLSVTCFLCLLTVSIVAVFVFKIANSLIRIGELRQTAATESVPAKEADGQFEEYDEADSSPPQAVTPTEAPQPEPTIQFESQGNVVSFTAMKKTFEDKYNALTAAQKNVYDEIAAYASAKQFIHRFKNNKYEEFKMGYDSVVRVVIRRSAVYCDFVSVSERLSEILTSHGMAVIKGVAVLELSDSASVQTAKSCIDASYDEVCKERLRRAEARRLAT